MALYRELDYGTPARSGAPVTVEIDGSSITVPAGTSLMRAAQEAGIAVPKLCASDSLEPFGSCRLCMVEIEGRRGFPASCTTPVEPGMKVRTQSPKLAELRRGTMELYISDHPLDCLTCSANGNCELQDMAGVVGLREVRYDPVKTHLAETKDESNPYFSFDPAKCIVCNRCVRACEEVQGTFALTISGRGFDSQVSAGQNEDFLDSECVSCGACVQACPTATLMEKSVIEMGQAERSVTTTCAYCGVGCSFNEAISYTAKRFKDIQAQYGRDSVGGLTSSRCTNEEAYLVQKLVRAAFGNNNVDTCARVCHSPTGYGLKVTLGESAGTQDFDSVLAADVVLVIGANPTDGHPVFGSQLKRRLREGAKLIVADPRGIDLVRGPHVKADHHLQLRPGSNVALLNSLAHVIVSEKLVNEDFVAERCETEAFEQWRAFVAAPRHSPEAMQELTGVPAASVRAAARLYATGGNAAIYYGLGVTEHSQGSSTVMAITNLAMATGNIGRAGVGVNPLRGQNNVQGSCDMGSFPHELPGYRHVSDPLARAQFEQAWGVTLLDEPGLRIPNMLAAAHAGTFKGMYIQGEDPAQSDPDTQHVTDALKAMECVVVQDLFLNETAKFAHVFLPGASFLEKNGTFTNAERRISPVRKVMPALAGKEDWEVTVALSNALGYPMNYTHPSQIMDEIASLTPTFTGVSYAKLDRLGSIQWPCNDAAPEGTPIMHEDAFVRGKGRFMVTEYIATEERTSRKRPLILTTGRILSQYNVGAQTRRTANGAWHAEDRLEIHPVDAEDRGINDGDWVSINSRAG